MGKRCRDKTSVQPAATMAFTWPPSPFDEILAQIQASQPPRKEETEEEMEAEFNLAIAQENELCWLDPPNDEPVELSCRRLSEEGDELDYDV